VSISKEYSSKEVVLLLRSSSSYVTHGRQTYPVIFYYVIMELKTC